MHVRISVAALSCTALLAACGGNDSRTTSDASVPVRGGTLTAVVPQPGPCLDPQVTGTDPQVIVAHQVLDNLVFENNTGEVEPWLAKSWTISPDGLVYTFTLRADVKFTDDTPMNAAAVKANLDRVLDPKIQSLADAIYLVPVLKSTEAVGDFVLKVNLKKAYAPLLHFLAQAFIGIQSPAGFSRGREVNCQDPIGTGPFKIESFTPNAEVRLVRNDNYNSPPPGSQNTGAAYLDRMVLKVVSDPAVAYAALNSGEADVIHSPLPQSWKNIKKNANQRLLSQVRPGTPNVILLGVTKAPLDDVRVRQAISCAGNVRAALKGAYLDEMKYEAGPLSSATSNYTATSENAYEYNPAKAAALLDQAGWTGRDANGYRTKNGVQLKFQLYYSLAANATAPDVTLLENMQFYLKQSGINLVLGQGSATEVYNMIAAGSITAVKGYSGIAGWYWPTNTPDVLRLMYTSDGLRAKTNLGGYSNPELDGVLTKAAVTEDQQQSQALYAKAQQMVSNAALSIPMYPATSRLAYNSKVHGLTVDHALGLPNFYGVWIAK